MVQQTLDLGSSNWMAAGPPLVSTSCTTGSGIDAMSFACRSKKNTWAPLALKMRRLHRHLLFPW